MPPCLVSTLFFFPMKFWKVVYPGAKAFRNELLGLLAMGALLVLIGFLLPTQHAGLLEAHSQTRLPLNRTISENLLDWPVLTIVMLLVAIIAFLVTSSSERQSLLTGGGKKALLSLGFYRDVLGTIFFVLMAQSLATYFLYDTWTPNNLFYVASLATYALFPLTVSGLGINERNTAVLKGLGVVLVQVGLANFLPGVLSASVGYPHPLEFFLELGMIYFLATGIGMMTFPGLGTTFGKGKIGQMKSLGLFGTLFIAGYALMWALVLIALGVWILLLIVLIPIWVIFFGDMDDFFDDFMMEYIIVPFHEDAGAMFMASFEQWLAPLNYIGAYFHELGLDLAAGSWPRAIELGLMLLAIHSVVMEFQAIYGNNDPGPQKSTKEIRRELDALAQQQDQLETKTQRLASDVEAFKKEFEERRQQKPADNEEDQSAGPT